jgi:hypothetical protein
MSLTFPVDAKLKDGSPVQLVLADEQDVEPLRRLYWVIVDKGNCYSYDRDARPLDLRAILSAIADRMVDKHWVFQ